MRDFVTGSRGRDLALFTLLVVIALAASYRLPVYYAAPDLPPNTTQQAPASQ